ncbi:MAG: efflux RND transporter permease subunit [Candidatus Riflebacteria bacterium]|nr:efflux RND transporter permease subunit [Candidatus Riflebacteria bacterium]
MNLAAICIKRPVFTVMITMALVVMGIISYAGLGLDLMPRIDLPIIRVFATFPGGNPEEIETQIAKPIEEACNTVGGIDQIMTKCQFGVAQVIVRFQLDKDINVASQEIRDRISRIMSSFPQGMDAPVIEKVDPDAMPVITLVVSGNMRLRDLTFFARKRIKEPLEAINGVGAIQMVGAREREIHIILDTIKMAKYGLTVSQVQSALEGQNLEIPGGQVTEGKREFILRTMGRLIDPRKFAEIIVATVGNTNILAKDIATIDDSEEEARTLARLDGVNCLSLVIQKQSGINTVEVIDSIKKRVADLLPGFPKGVKVLPIRDTSEFIKASLHELNGHLILGSTLASLVVMVFMGNATTGFILAILVVIGLFIKSLVVKIGLFGVGIAFMLFMGNWVSTVIAATAIPVSLITTFFLMHLMGFTLNNMSMLGLTLAVGIVIDDAIVVLENIFRHMEEKGSDAIKAANEGTAEIYMAVMATSLSLMVIFVPVAFMQGIIGRLLNNYGLTIAFSILVSIFVSFTLTPMLCSRFFQYQFAVGSGHSKDSGFYRVIDGVYGVLLRFSMRHRWVIILAAIACLGSMYFLKSWVRTDFIPADDTNEMVINFRADEGSSLEGTSDLMKEMEDKIRTLPGIVHIFGSIGEGEGTGVNEGAIYVQLVDIRERDLSQFEIMQQARVLLKPYDKFRVAVSPASTWGTARNADVTYSIAGPDLEKITTYADFFSRKLLDNPKVVGSVDCSTIPPKPEIHVVLDRERAYRMGIRLEVVASALRTMVGGVDEITRYKEGDEMYEVRVRLRPEDRGNVRAISNLMFMTGTGAPTPLDTFASVTTGFGPAQIDRTDRQRSITVNVNLAKGAAMGDVNEIINQGAAELNIPSEYTCGFVGKSREMARTVRGFIFAFMISAIFMYMILASQFESYLHPITIMLSLPLSVPFALISLLLAQQTLNVYSALGVFMLFGIVKKNSILQIDYMNTLRGRGMERLQAVYDANHARLRPILMTTITLVAGMLPMALGKGAGAATRAPMAVVIIGGQSLCLLITLLLTPVAYTIFDDIVVFLGRVLPVPAKAQRPETVQEEKTDIIPN